MTRLHLFKASFPLIFFIFKVTSSFPQVNIIDQNQIETNSIIKASNSSNLTSTTLSTTYMTSSEEFSDSTTTSSFDFQNTTTSSFDFSNTTKSSLAILNSTTSSFDFQNSTSIPEQSTTPPSASNETTAVNVCSIRKRTCFLRLKRPENIIINNNCCKNEMCTPHLQRRGRIFLLMSRLELLGYVEGFCTKKPQFRMQSGSMSSQSQEAN